LYQFSKTDTYLRRLSVLYIKHYSLDKYDFIQLAEHFPSCIAAQVTKASSGAAS